MFFETTQKDFWVRDTMVKHWILKMNFIRSLCSNPRKVKDQNKKLVILIVIYKTLCLR